MRERDRDRKKRIDIGGGKIQGKSQKNDEKKTGGKK